MFDCLRLGYQEKGIKVVDLVSKVELSHNGKSVTVEKSKLVAEMVKEKDILTQLGIVS